MFNIACLLTPGSRDFDQLLGLLDYLIFIKTEICTKPLILCSLIP